MKALVLHEIGKLTLDEVPVEPLRPGTVLVKIKACGICSSDVERVFINGTYHFPTIPGHEFSGQIVAVGDDVDESLLGRRTCVFPMLPCFECPSCKKQQYAQCSHYDYFGSRRDGGYAEYLVVPTWNLVLFDDDLSYDVAAMCEPAAVGIHANGLANVQKGQSVLVIGTGMIGYVCAAFASQITDKVIMCGNSAAKLELAKKYGWETIALETDNFEERINDRWGRCGCSYGGCRFQSGNLQCCGGSRTEFNDCSGWKSKSGSDHGKEFILENFKKIHHFTWILEFQL